jgi:hypothetical protein
LLAGCAAWSNPVPGSITRHYANPRRGRFGPLRCNHIFAFGLPCGDAGGTGAARSKHGVRPRASCLGVSRLSAHRTAARVHSQNGAVPQRTNAAASFRLIKGVRFRQEHGAHSGSKRLDAYDSAISRCGSKCLVTHGSDVSGQPGR